MHNAPPLQGPVLPHLAGPFLYSEQTHKRGRITPGKDSEIGSNLPTPHSVRNNMGHLNAFRPALPGARHPGALDSRASFPVSLMECAAPAPREEQA